MIQPKMNLRVLLILSLFLIAFHSPAQSKYARIDSRASSVKTFKNLGDLSTKLTFGYKTDLEKVRSIFYWITQNILYDRKEYRSDSINSYYTRIRAYLEENKIAYTDSLYNKLVLDTVMRKKAAICDGYARLFKTLCNKSGIKSEMINGMGKNSVNNLNTFVSNHSWNNVLINEKWYLLDACWATEFDTLTKKIYPQIDEFYFLSDPKYFSYSHYPDDKKYLYHSNPFTKQQFSSLPLVYSHFFDSGFDNFSPLNGIISKPKNNKITISIGKVFAEKVNEFESQELSLKKTEIRYQLEQKIDSTAESVIIYYRSKGILEYALKKD